MLALLLSLSMLGPIASADGWNCDVLPHDPYNAETAALNSRESQRLGRGLRDVPNRRDDP